MHLIAEKNLTAVVENARLKIQPSQLLKVVKM